MQPEKKILVSFDVEEFDLPLEYNQPISTEQQLQVGYNGFAEVLSLTDALRVPTTLYVTGFFAENFPSIIQQAAASHEIASHAYSHGSFYPEDVKKSKEVLQRISGQQVVGFRMPRMGNVPVATIKQAGYLYDSSINPTWIPGRYNHLKTSKKPFVENNLWRLPVSVTPTMRIPLFWLAFKNLPYSLFLQMARQTLRKNGYLNLYFHPWEFIDLSAYKIPGYIKRGSKQALLGRLRKLLNDLSGEGNFTRTIDFVNCLQTSGKVM